MIEQIIRECIKKEVWFDELDSSLSYGEKKEALAEQWLSEVNALIRHLNMTLMFSTAPPEIAKHLIQSPCESMFFTLQRIKLIDEKQLQL